MELLSKCFSISFQLHLNVTDSYEAPFFRLPEKALWANKGLHTLGNANIFRQLDVVEPVFFGMPHEPHVSNGVGVCFAAEVGS